MPLPEKLNEHTAVVLVNLGSPNSPSVKDVRAYLRQFLMDARVIDLPAVPRWLLVNGIISVFRAPRSAKAYRRIWADSGSPLVGHTRDCALALQEAAPAGWIVDWAMRYGSPGIAQVLSRLEKAGIRRLIVLPLYPQYASSTSGSVAEEVMRIVGKQWRIPAVEIAGPFFDHPAYLDAMLAGMDTVRLRSADKLLFSFHGLPWRHIAKLGCQTACMNRCQAEGCTSDPLCYYSACYQSARMLASRIGLQPGSWSVSFQSRFAKDWLGPHTDDEIKRLAAEGCRDLAIVSPSFVADCLETLEEIGIHARKTFLDCGGQSFYLAPCLNSSPNWIAALKIIAGMG